MYSASSLHGVGLVGGEHGGLVGAAGVVDVFAVGGAVACGGAAVAFGGAVGAASAFAAAFAVHFKVRPAVLARWYPVVQFGATIRHFI